MNRKDWRHGKDPFPKDMVVDNSFFLALQCKATRRVRVPVK